MYQSNHFLFWLVSFLVWNSTQHIHDNWHCTLLSENIRIINKVSLYHTNSKQWPMDDSSYCLVSLFHMRYNWHSASTLANVMIQSYILHILHPQISLRINEWMKTVEKINMQFREYSCSKVISMLVVETETLSNPIRLFFVNSDIENEPLIKEIMDLFIVYFEFWEEQYIYSYSWHYRSTLYCYLMWQMILH